MAALKQDAKHFGYHMMVLERQKRVALEPVYQLMKALLPALAISQQNPPVIDGARESLVIGTV